MNACFWDKKIGCKLDFLKDLVGGSDSALIALPITLHNTKWQAIPILLALCMVSYSQIER
jgi:hypothetical protein